MPPVGFEPAIPASERPQTYALDRAATGTGIMLHTRLPTQNIRFPSLPSVEALCIRTYPHVHNLGHFALSTGASRLVLCHFCFT